jgi:hypothetical protein
LGGGAVYDGQMLRLFLLFVAAAVAGCGAAPQYAPSPAYRGEPEATAADEAPPAAPMEEMQRDVSSVGGATYGAAAPSTPPPPPPSQTPAAQPAPAGLDQQLIVYSGYLKLRVKRLLAAVDAVTALTEKSGGYVESLTQRVIVVRVPRGDFETTLNAFAALGQVLDRRVQALDVTQQFTDLQSRLVVARNTRDRLLKLLESTTDADERRRILQEVKRLSEQIESMEATLSALQNLVDFYTITLELEPVLDTTGAQVHRSPFPWVRDLQPHLQTITEGNGDFDMSLPDGFVLFDEDDAWRAQSADTSMLRGGTVENEPRGDAAFWADAVDHEMEGRDEERVAAGESGPVTYRVYRNKDLQPRWYLVGLRPDKDDVYVIEAFFPNEDAWKAHGDAVIKALGTFRVK